MLTHLMLMLALATPIAVQAVTPVPVNKAKSADESMQISFPVEKFQLDNGLTVILAQDRTVPMVSYHTWYRVGSRDEKPGVTGAAHMLEHMMFKGAKKYSDKDFDRILHENGIKNNAFTTLHLNIAPPTLGGKIAVELFKALKPGGVLLVVDHVGTNAGGPFSDANALHRGDPAATRKEIETAGFRLKGTSTLYARADDPHTANVFDPAIRGKTDQFIYTFVKPKG